MIKKILIVFGFVDTLFAQTLKQ